MQYNPAKHHRQSIRLRGYDYARAGVYFVTVCTHDRACLFGDVVDGEMRLNELGTIVHDEWFRTPDIRGEIALDAFVVMPNHIHGIVLIQHADGGPVGAGYAGATSRSPLRTNETKSGPPNKSLGAFMAGFKSIATKRINALRDTPGIRVWQRNYHDRIIQDDTALNRIRQYITDNPAKWEGDGEH